LEKFVILVSSTCIGLICWISSLFSNALALGSYAESIAYFPMPQLSSMRRFNCAEIQHNKLHFSKVKRT